MGFLQKILDARHDNVVARQQGRTDRNEDKQDAKKDAYDAGIDPNAGWQDIINHALDIGQEYLTPGGGSGGSKEGQPLSPPAPPTTTPMYVWLIGGAAVLWFLMKKK